MLQPAFALCETSEGQASQPDKHTYCEDMYFQIRRWTHVSIDQGSRNARYENSGR